MAPEIIEKTPSYGHSVDWWAFGILLFTMLSGDYPFLGDSNEELFSAILRNSCTFKPWIQQDARYLIREVCFNFISVAR